MTMRANRAVLCLAGALLATIAFPSLASATVGAPIITGVKATHVTANDAILKATVKPDGRETHYEMVLGLCPEGEGECLNQFATVAEGTIAPRGAAVHLEVDLLRRLDEISLQSGKTYFYFVRARNVNGEETEVSKTFQTRP